MQKSIICKEVHLVGIVTGTDYDARTYERQNLNILRNKLDHNESFAIYLPLILTITLRFKIGVFLDV
jgi:uncharacterized protein (UPF0216 family)